MAWLKTDGIKEVDAALRAMRASIVQLKFGIQVCEQQEAANLQTIEELSTLNAGYSAKASGARSLITQIDSIVPPSNA